MHFLRDHIKKKLHSYCSRVDECEDIGLAFSRLLVQILLETELDSGELPHHYQIVKERPAGSVDLNA